MSRVPSVLLLSTTITSIEPYVWDLMDSRQAGKCRAEFFVGTTTETSSKPPSIIDSSPAGHGDDALQSTGLGRLLATALRRVPSPRSSCQATRAASSISATDLAVLSNESVALHRRASVTRRAYNAESFIKRLMAIDMSAGRGETISPVDSFLTESRSP